MKLEKFKEKNQKRTKIIVFTILCILLIGGVFFYQSFALFEVKENFNILKGNIESPGDLSFVYYVDDVVTKNPPTMSSGYTLSSKSSCNNGVTVTWDNKNWSALVNYTNYQKTNASVVKCSLYFNKTIVQQNKEYLLEYSSEYLKNDNTSDYNLRYVGANPNNYVNFNNELWRIIGVMNSIDDGFGNFESKLKLVRNESIGEFSYDSSSSLENGGYGVNSWNHADIMKLLNSGYENESIGGSLYWNSLSGSCYGGTRETTKNCDFTNIGLQESSKSMISNAVWNVGSNGTVYWDNITSSKFYELERGDVTGKICTSGTFCTDTVSRSTTWLGKIGLLYPSDYGFATSIDSCLDKKMASWSNFSDCFSNDWLHHSNKQWSITPRAGDVYANDAFYLDNEGNMSYGSTAAHLLNIYPTFYLSSSVKIIGGSGTQNNPFQLQ